MWTKNGQASLRQVLSQINKVIPDEVVNQKFIVDDKSSDDTKTIAKACGWDIRVNEGIGISDGANTALKNVETDLFASFEQDLLLSTAWWAGVKDLVDSHCVVASGVRFSDKPESLVKLQRYTAERYRKKTIGQNWYFGRSLDNTLYDTAFLRSIGGFPKLSVNAGVDNALAKKVFDAGKLWRVNFNIASVHLHGGLNNELRHYYWYGTCQYKLKRELGDCVDTFREVFVRTCFSPVRGIEIAFKQRSWPIAFVYPAIRMASFAGVVQSYLKGYLSG
jgi:hypothetical protein